MHRITRRRVERSDFHNSDEVGALRLSDWGCALLLFGVLPGLVLGLIGRRIGEAIGSGGETAGLLTGWSLGLLVFIVAMYVSHKQRAEQIAFLSSGEVEQIDVEQAVCYAVDLFNSDPILAIDIGVDKLLVLQGQWLQDSEIFGCDRPQDDPVDEHFNGLPAPWAFPSSEFSLVRRTDTGDVIRIRPLGSYAEPHNTNLSIELDYSLPQSQVLECSIQNLTDELLNSEGSRSAA